MFEWKEKEEPERSVSERRRREASRRGSSADGARSFTAARGLGGAVSSPSGPGGARPPNDIWCIFGLKMLYLARPQGLL